MIYTLHCKWYKVGELLVLSYAASSQAAVVVSDVVIKKVDDDAVAFKWDKLLLSLIKVHVVFNVYDMLSVQQSLSLI